MILLTTPIDTGSLDEDYTHVRVQDFRMDRLNQVIIIVAAAGYLTDGEFVQGAYANPQSFEILDNPNADPPVADYTEMVGGSYGDEGVLLYDSVAEVLDTWLISNEHYAGTHV